MFVMDHKCALFMQELCAIASTGASAVCDDLIGISADHRSPLSHLTGAVFRPIVQRRRLHAWLQRHKAAACTYTDISDAL